MSHYANLPRNAAFAILSFAVVSGCSVPKNAGTAKESSVTATEVRPAATDNNAAANKARPAATPVRSTANKATAGSATSSVQSEYYSSHYVSDSRVIASDGSGYYGAEGHRGGRDSQRAAWVDGYGRAYSEGVSHGGFYRDGGPGAAYAEVVTDDRARSEPWLHYNYRRGLSNGY